VLSQLTRHHSLRAAAVDPLDPTPHAKLAEWSLMLTDLPEMKEEALAEANAELDEAIARDPHHLKLRQLRVQLRRLQARETGRREELHKVVEAAREALALYPADPAGFVTLADALRDEGLASGDRSVLQSARVAYQQSLRLDGSRLSWETIRRFSESRRLGIEERIRQMSSLIGE
jgi:tetratricopeptide (TPR) repeat protein